MRIEGLSQFAHDIASGGLKHAAAEVRKQSGRLLTVGSLTNEDTRAVRPLAGPAGAMPSDFAPQIAKLAMPRDVLMIVYQPDDTHVCVHVERDGDEAFLLTADVVGNELGDLAIDDTRRLLPIRKPS
jgi:hypothetical protein